jgi:hypothetical protein
MITSISHMKMKYAGILCFASTRTEIDGQSGDHTYIQHDTYVTQKSNR